MEPPPSRCRSNALIAVGKVLLIAVRLTGRGTGSVPDRLQLLTRYLRQQTGGCGAWPFALSVIIPDP
jgi:hypothetical protein